MSEIYRFKPRLITDLILSQLNRQGTIIELGVDYKSLTITEQPCKDQPGIEFVVEIHR